MNILEDLLSHWRKATEWAGTEVEYVVQAETTRSEAIRRIGPWAVQRS